MSYEVLVLADFLSFFFFLVNAGSMLGMLTVHWSF